MILADTSVWIDFIDRGSSQMQTLLEHDQVLMHPFVLGEFAMGTPRDRAKILADFAALPQAKVAQQQEVMAFLEAQRLYGLGIGFIDVHLLASVKLTPRASLWTNDQRLRRAAEKLGLSYRTT